MASAIRFLSTKRSALSTISKIAWTILAALAALLAVQDVAAQNVATQLKQAASDHETIFRFDFFHDSIVPVPKDQLKPGNIYNHFSKRVNRRVWSYLQADGSFWHAFGPGTVQAARMMDIYLTREQAIRDLSAKHRDFADELERTGGMAMLRLQPDGNWTTAGVNLAPTIFDAETSRLWQWVTNKYLPISHSPFGYLWTAKNGAFYPATSGRIAHSSAADCCP